MSLLETLSPNEIIDKWVTALKSGQYQQGHYKLKYEKDGQFYYCCLGVLCEVLEIPSAVCCDDDRNGHKIYRFGIDDKVLPPQICDRLKIGPTGMNSESNSLAYKNDEGSTFLEIANFIESRPNDLFNLKEFEWSVKI